MTLHHHPVNIGDLGHSVCLYRYRIFLLAVKGLELCGICRQVPSRLLAISQICLLPSRQHRIKYRSFFEVCDSKVQFCRRDPAILPIETCQFRKHPPLLCHLLQMPLHSAAIEECEPFDSAFGVLHCGSSFPKHLS